MDFLLLYKYFKLVDVASLITGFSLSYGLLYFPRIFKWFTLILAFDLIPSIMHNKRSNQRPVKTCGAAAYEFIHITYIVLIWLEKIFIVDC